MTKGEAVIYRPQSGETVRTWDACCEIRYQGVCIHLRYETEPPFGDFLYTLALKGHSAPYVVYGRNLLFSGDCALMEGYGSSGGIDLTRPLCCVLLDLKRLRYAELPCRFADVAVENGGVAFADRRIALENLPWIPLPPVGGRGMT